MDYFSKLDDWMAPLRIPSACDLKGAEKDLLKQASGCTSGNGVSWLSGGTLNTASQN
jgi:hypothetical protein